MTRNLSEWKGGGYRGWQEQQEKRGLLRQLTEEAGEPPWATASKPTELSQIKPN
jgi:hypothetical protein